MKPSTIALFVMFFGAGIAMTAHTPPFPSELMKKKTEHAQNILKYLALGDLGKVKSEADQLEKLTTDAGFEGKSEQYAEYGKEFLKLVNNLSKDAANGNLAGSYYQFTRMTSVCFSCHEHIRDAGKKKN